MKVLIVSITAGEGHNAMGKAIATYLNQNYPLAEVKIIDLYKDNHKLQAFMVNNLQFFMVKYFPNLMHLNYKLSINRKPNIDKNFSLKMGLIAKDSFLKEVNAFQPDVILSTHTFSTALLSYCIRNKLFFCKTYALIPDYVMHPDPENNADVDFVFSPYQQINSELIEKGVPEEKIRTYGLPCHPKFMEVHNKERLIHKYKIDKSKLTVLVMNGGKNMGVSSNFSILKKVLKCESSINVIVVNGNNEQSKRKIDNYLLSHPNPNVLNIGFTNEIDELMVISDVMIGKSGGSTMTEALQMRLPVIVPLKPPYQELWTMRRFEEWGIITHLDSLDRIPSYLEYLVKNPGELALMIRNMDKIRKDESTKKICDFIMNNV